MVFDLVAIYMVGVHSGGIWGSLGDLEKSTQRLHSEHRANILFSQCGFSSV